jgi:hypothetical protein
VKVEKAIKDQRKEVSERGMLLEVYRIVLENKQTPARCRARRPTGSGVPLFTYTFIAGGVTRGAEDRPSDTRLHTASSAFDAFLDTLDL